MINFNILTNHYAEFLEGLWITIYLVSGSLLLGLCFSIPLACFRHAKLPILNKATQAYTYFFRGTPLLLQVYLVYYGSGQFDFIRESFLWYFLKEAYFCALTALTLNTCAYTTEILRGVFDTVPKKEIEAARAFGLNRFRIFTGLIFPNAIRRSIPAYGNEVIFMIHGSAVISVITILDLTGTARYFYAKYYDPFTPFIIAGGLYFLLVFAVIKLFKFFEKKYMAHLKSATGKNRLTEPSLSKISSSG